MGAKQVPIRVLVIVGSLNRGGCESHLLEVLPALDAKQINVEVFVMTERGVLAQCMERRGVRVFRPRLRIGSSPWLLMRVSRIALIAIQLWFFLLIRRPDIVHFFLPASYLMGAPVAILAGVHRRLMSRRSLNQYQRNHRIAGLFERILHRTMRVIIGNSRRVVQELVDQEGVSLKDAALIYNGVHANNMTGPALRARGREELGLGRDALVLIMVANLIPYKGHVDLLRALAEANPDLPAGWVLLAVGRDDGIGQCLSTLAGELEISTRVKWLGERDDVASLAAIADIGLLTSHEEGFPNVVLEGMAAGLPMVVTDAGGSVEAVVDGETGRVVPVGDPIRLAQAITELANNADLRLLFGNAGRQRVLEQFGIGRCVDSYLRLYEAVHTGRPVDELPGVRASDFVISD